MVLQILTPRLEPSLIGLITNGKFNPFFLIKFLNFSLLKPFFSHTINLGDLIL